MLYRILPHLYLSDLESVNNLSSHDSIQVVLSIGCVSNHQSGIEYLEFPSLQDDPKVFLMSIWDYTCSFIVAKISKEENVLVHCVYGQSRSVSTIIAYMVRNCKYSLPDALALVRCKKTDISINPGFLSQLWYLNYILGQSSAMAVADCRGMMQAWYQHCHDYLYTKHLTITSTIVVKTLIEIVADRMRMTTCTEEIQEEKQGDSLPSFTTNLYCRYCKTCIVPEDRIVHRSLNQEVMTFLDENVDDFWRHSYRRKKPGKKVKRTGTSSSGATSTRKHHLGEEKEDINTVFTAPIEGYYTIAPTEWMVLEQQQSAREQRDSNREYEKGQIHCQHCRRVIGEYKREALSIIGDLFLLDLYILSIDAICRW